MDDLCSRLNQMNCESDLYNTILRTEIDGLAKMYVDIIQSPHTFHFVMEINPLLERLMLENTEMYIEMVDKISMSISQNNFQQLKAAISTKLSVTLFEENILETLVNEYNFYCKS